jgi:hypothetical protein
MIANDEGCGKWGDGPNQQVRDFARLFYNESKAKEEEETNSLGTPFEELDVNDQMNMLVAFFGQHEDIEVYSFAYNRWVPCEHTKPSDFYPHAYYRYASNEDYSYDLPDGSNISYSAKDGVIAPESITLTDSKGNRVI